MSVRQDNLKYMPNTFYWIVMVNIVNLVVSFEHKYITPNTSH